MPVSVSSFSASLLVHLYLHSLEPRCIKSRLSEIVYLFLKWRWPRCTARLQSRYIDISENSLLRYPLHLLHMAHASRPHHHLFPSTSVCMHIRGLELELQHHPLFRSPARILPPSVHEGTITIDIEITSPNSISMQVDFVSGREKLGHYHPHLRYSLCPDMAWSLKSL